MTIYFGEYLKSLKEDNVKINSSTLDSDEYYLGSDGIRYAKVEVKSYDYEIMYFK